MKVLVVGYAKTGTKTLYAALDMLGYKAYDYEHNFYYLREQWAKILSQKGGSKEDFYEMYKDVDATMDMPACNFWEDIFEAFPDTKLIFSERRSEHEWWESLTRMWDNIHGNWTLKLLSLLSPTMRSLFQYSYRLVPVCFGAESPGFWSSWPKVSPNVAKMIYRNHNARVKEKAPKDQLLIFNPSEGWEPLCKFLGKPVPDCDFPHKNKGGNIADEKLAESPIYQQMKYEAATSISVLVCVFAIVMIYFLAF